MGGGRYLHHLTYTYGEEGQGLGSCEIGELAYLPFGKREHAELGACKSLRFDLRPTRTNQPGPLAPPQGAPPYTARSKI